MSGEQSEQQIVFASFRLDVENACLWREDHTIPLTPKAFAVLRYLVERPSRLVSKEELLTAVWPDAVVGEAVLKTSVRELRKALADNPKTPQFIETVHRRGYRFIGRVVSSQNSVVSRETAGSRQQAVKKPAPWAPLSAP